MKKLALGMLLMLSSLPLQAEDMISKIDYQMLIDKVSSTASATYNCTNYRYNLLGVYVTPSSLSESDTIKIQVEHSKDNENWDYITSLNVMNIQPDASGTVKLFNSGDSPSMSEIQLVGSEYFRVKALYEGSAVASITVFTAKSGKIIGD